MSIGGFRLNWLQRRWWLLAASVLVVSAVAQIIYRPTPTQYRAETVLVVRSGATTNTPGSASEANRLAITYSQLIGQDSQVLDRIARTLNVTQQQVQDHLGTSNDFNTSILRVGYTASNARTAISGARAAADALVGNAPASSNFSGLALSRLPDQATEHSQSNTTLPVGAVLGLCLGVVLVIAWERVDGRLDDEAAVREELDCPVTVLEGLSAGSIVALLGRWSTLAAKPPAHVAIVAVTTNHGSLTAEVADVLANAAGSTDYPDGQRLLKGLTLASAGAPGPMEVGEATAQRADLTVLVVVEGTRTTTLRSALAALAEFGVTPGWVLYANERLVRRARRLRPSGEAMVIEVEPPVSLTV